MVLPLDTPLTPDTDQARAWLEGELSRAEYGTELSPLTRAIARIIDVVLEALTSGSTGVRPGLALLGIGALAVLLVAAALLFAPLTRTPRRPTAQVFDDGSHTLTSVRAHMDAAHEAGDWAAASVWAFRLLVVHLARLDLLALTPGLTAHEVADRAGAHLPAPGLPLSASDLSGAAALFDAIRYGQAPATREDFDRLHHLALAAGDTTRAEPAAAGRRP